MYKKEMRKCFRLAQKGAGKTSPNPLVGCVVLNKYGKEISNGYHHKYGENHAERDALLKLSPKQTQGGTIVVNLEPCNHYGKTPPCSDLIIEYGIKRVVIANRDPNPKAAGGIEKLKQNNIEVIEGVLEEEGKFLNRIFFKNIKEKKTYIVLKTASTLDGKIAAANGDSKWITSSNARNLARKFRQEFDSILTTAATIIADNPQMLHHKKIILDRNCKLNFSENIFNTGEKIYLVNSLKNRYSKELPDNVEITYISETGNGLNLSELFEKTYEKGIMSIFIEAGSKLNGEIIKQDLADEIIQFTAPKILNDNIGISCFNGDTANYISQTKNFKLVELKQVLPDYYARFIK